MDLELEPSEPKASPPEPEPSLGPDIPPELANPQSSVEPPPAPTPRYPFQTQLLLVLAACAACFLLGGAMHFDVLFVLSLLGLPGFLFYVGYQDRQGYKPPLARQMDNQIRLVPLLMYIFGAGIVLSYYVDKFASDSEMDKLDFTLRVLGGAGVMLVAVVYDHRCKQRERQSKGGADGS